MVAIYSRSARMVGFLPTASRQRGGASACIAALVDSTFFPDTVCPLETPIEVSVVDTYASRPHRHPPTGDGSP